MTRPMSLERWRCIREAGMVSLLQDDELPVTAVEVISAEAKLSGCGPVRIE
jgi:hypothetical protein